MIAASIRNALTRCCRWPARFLFHLHGRTPPNAAPQHQEIIVVETIKSASEALVATPLPEMIKNLGLAVAAANRALIAETPASDQVQMVVQEADIEINVAISLALEEKLSGGASFSGLKVISINAAYARSFNFKEEASSKIRLKLSVAPRQPAA